MDGLTLDKAFKRCGQTNKYYCGVFSVDNFPAKCAKSYPCFYLVNTDLSSGGGEHWLILFYTTPQHLEIFDSLGQTPYAYKPRLLEYIENFGPKTVVYTNKRLQSLKSNVCGAHCLFFGFKKCQKKISMASLLNRYYLRNTNYNDCSVLCFAKKQFRIKPRTIRLMLKTVSKCNLKLCTINKND
jgi:hypothetical protein